MNGIEINRDIYQNSLHNYVLPESNETKSSKEELNKDENAVSSESKTTFDSPAAELLINNTILNRIRGLSQTALMDTNHTFNNKEGNFGEVSKIISKLSTLSAKASSKDLSKGERSYIESEINFLERNINTVSLSI